jgi:hypothetical protein
LKIECAPAHRPVVSPSDEASSKRQGDGQRFQKKAMKTTNQNDEATAPASVRPSLSKMAEWRGQMNSELKTEPLRIVTPWQRFSCGLWRVPEGDISGAYSADTMPRVKTLGIGAAVIIWMAANLPKTPARSNKPFFFNSKPPQTPAWRKDISEVFSTDGFDYLRKLGRHQNDPQHWPAPFPPPEPPK